MITHFDEIKDNLQAVFKETALKENIVALLGLPSLYKVIIDNLDGDEVKVGFFDSLNLHERQVSILNLSRAAECIDFINLAKQLGCKNIIGIGLAGAYKYSLGTLFVAKKAISEELLTSYFTDNKIGIFDEYLFNRNKTVLNEFSSNNDSDFKIGVSVSLDLFSRETYSFINQQRELVDVVEMEVAPLYIMSNLYGINCFSLFFISDKLNKSYFLRDNEDRSIIHNIYNQIPKLIMKLKF